MNIRMKRVAAACAGAFLLAACADFGQRVAVQGPEAGASPAARDAWLLARSQHLAGRHDAALASYAAALKADPRHVNARNGLAALHAERGDLARAISLWLELTGEAAGRAGPESAFLFSNLGYAHLLQGEAEKARAVLEKACVLDPLNARAWNHLGNALEKLGETDRAQLMYRQAAALRQHDFKADYALAKRAGVAAIDQAVRAAPRADDGWATTEVRQLASGMYELHRVAAPAGPQIARREEAPAPLPAPRPSAEVLAVLPEPPSPGKAMLEIRNGNGVTGMAKALSHKMDGDRLRVVRLSNQRPFNVALTRIEFGPAFRQEAERLAARFDKAEMVEVANCKRADMLLVIGRDVIGPQFALRPVVRGEPGTFAQHQTHAPRARDNGQDDTQPGA